MLNVSLLKAALVVDPVMISTSGDILAGPSVLAGFRYEFLNLNYAASVRHQSIFPTITIYLKFNFIFILTCTTLDKWILYRNTVSKIIQVYQ